MKELRVAIHNTYPINMGEIMSMITTTQKPKVIRDAVRSEVQFLISEMCERIMDCPNLSEAFLAWQLCREGLAEPRPGYEPPGWDQTLRERERAA